MQISAIEQGRQRKKKKKTKKEVKSAGIVENWEAIKHLHRCAVTSVKSTLHFNSDS